MDIFFTNNLTNKKEQFVPKDNKHIGMYVCGPTVYDDPHIGNARPLVIFDILFRLLKNKFSKVYLFNPTPIYKSLWHIATNCVAVKKENPIDRYVWKQPNNYQS